MAFDKPKDPQAIDKKLFKMLNGYGNIDKMFVQACIEYCFLS